MTKTYAVGTNVRDIESFDRSTKVVFECKHHKGIWHMSKQPSCSNWFPANEAARDIADGGYENDPCDHMKNDDVWILAQEYTS